MREKFIRKQPLLSKIKSYPFDFIIYINEFRLSIEWDDYAETIALTLGISLLIFYLVIAKVLNYYDIVHSKSENVLFQTNYNNYERLKARLLEKNITVNSYNYTFVHVLKWINIALFISSILSCYIIFTSSRSYNLLYRADKPNTPSVRRLKLNQLSLYEKIKKFLEFGGLFDENIETDEVKIDLADKEIYQLIVWNPSKFLLYLEIAFNPLNLMVLQFYSVNFFLLKTLSIVTLISFGIYTLIHKFFTLVNDKQILYKEMFSEFNNKFVGPKTNILKKDVSIDSTKGPYGSTVLTNIKPYSFTKSKLFLTHDANGNQIKNYHFDTSKSLFLPETNTTLSNHSGFYDILQSSRTPTNDFYNVKSENEVLKFRNEQLQKQLNSLKKQSDIFNEKFDENSISTPVSSRNFEQMSRDRILNTMPSLGVQNIQFRSPYVTKSSSPSKNSSRSPSPTKSFQRTPSPVRSPYKSPSRRNSEIYGRTPQRSPNLKGSDLQSRPDLSPEIRNTDFRRSPILRTNNFSPSAFLRSEMNKSPPMKSSNPNRSPSTNADRYFDKSFESKPRWR